METKPVPTFVSITYGGRGIAQSEPHPGDVLAVVRAGGLYMHYAVYIGNGSVIHYAAENGDFSGQISVHETSLSNFQGDSDTIYIVQFPDDNALPNRLGRTLCALQSGSSDESLLFGFLRAFSYHVYTPEETVKRAKSRLGEQSYSLAANNCEHFAIWCKTGVRESHQVNVWLTRIVRWIAEARRRRKDI